MVRDRDMQKMKLQMKLLQIRFEKKDIDEMLEYKLIELKNENCRMFSPPLNTMTSFRTDRGATTFRGHRQANQVMSATNVGNSAKSRNLVTQPIRHGSQYMGHTQREKKDSDLLDGWVAFDGERIVREAK